MEMRSLFKKKIQSRALRHTVQYVMMHAFQRVICVILNKLNTTLLLLVFIALGQAYILFKII
jgi:hypothetical protein